jgi:hypothetical protein
VRDTADPKGQREPPWYTKDARVSLDAARTVKSSDGPQMPVPWRTRNGKGRLVSTEGADAYFTWLAVRRKADKKVIPLAWAGWQVNWGCRFDPQKETYTLDGADTTISGKGDDGAGLVQPNLEDLVAIDDVSATWAGPPDG